MYFGAIIWDLDDDLEGNVHHCADHGVTKEEVEEVLQSAANSTASRSSGQSVVFGDTDGGRYLIVVYELIDRDTIYIVTAYDVPRRTKP